MMDYVLYFFTAAQAAPLAQTALFKSNANGTGNLGNLGSNKETRIEITKVKKSNSGYSVRKWQLKETYCAEASVLVIDVEVIHLRNKVISKNPVPERSFVSHYSVNNVTNGL